MEVAHVDDERMRVLGHAGSSQRAQHRRRRGVHHDHRQPALRVAVSASGAQPGHDLRHIRDAAGQRAQAPVRVQAVDQVVHAKLAVADVGRRRAVIEDRQRQGIRPQLDAERGKGRPDGV